MNSIRNQLHKSIIKSQSALKNGLEPHSNDQSMSGALKSPMMITFLVEDKDVRKEIKDDIYSTP